MQRRERTWGRVGEIGAEAVPGPIGRVHPHALCDNEAVRRGGGGALGNDAPFQNWEQECVHPPPREGGRVGYPPPRGGVVGRYPPPPPRVGGGSQIFKRSLPGWGVSGVKKKPARGLPWLPFSPKVPGQRIPNPKCGPPLCHAGSSKGQKYTRYLLGRERPYTLCDNEASRRVGGLALRVWVTFWLPFRLRPRV